MESKHKGEWQDLRVEETAKKEDNEKKLLPGQTTLKTISVKSAKVIMGQFYGTMWAKIRS